MDKYECGYGDPLINIHTGKAATIVGWAETEVDEVDLVSVRSRIVFDAYKPDDRLRKRLDGSQGLLWAGGAYAAEIWCPYGVCRR